MPRSVVFSPLVPFASPSASAPEPESARFLSLRAEAVAAEARRRPMVARAGRNWLRLAARRAHGLGLPSLAHRIVALERGIV